MHKHSTLLAWEAPYRAQCLVNAFHSNPIAPLNTLLVCYAPSRLDALLAPLHSVPSDLTRRSPQHYYYKDGLDWCQGYDLSTRQDILRIGR